MMFVSNRHIEAWWRRRGCSVWTQWCSAAWMWRTNQFIPQWQLAVCYRASSDTLPGRRYVQNICRVFRSGWKVFPDEMLQWSAFSQYCLVTSCLMIGSFRRWSVDRASIQPIKNLCHWSTYFLFSKEKTEGYCLT